MEQYASREAERRRGSRRQRIGSLGMLRCRTTNGSGGVLVSFCVFLDLAKVWVSQIAPV